MIIWEWKAQFFLIQVIYIPRIISNKFCGGCVRERKTIEVGMRGGGGLFFDNEVFIVIVVIVGILGSLSSRFDHVNETLIFLSR